MRRVMQPNCMIILLKSLKKKVAEPYFKSLGFCNLFAYLSSRNLSGNKLPNPIQR